MKTITIQLVSLLLVLSGCASIERSTLLGASAAGALGAGVGAGAGNNVRSALLGLGIGAIVGGAMGFAVHKDEEAKRGQIINPLVTKDFKQKVPTLTTPEVRRVWIQPKIESNRYEDGHFLYVIDRPAVWGK